MTVNTSTGRVNSPSNDAEPHTVGNKILFAFSNSVKERSEIIASICSTAKTTDGSIIRSIPWHTKYYSLDLDLYIDEFDDLDVWLEDFHKMEFDELREVLGGFVLVLPYENKELSDRLKQLSRTLNTTREYFTILLTTAAIEGTAGQELKDDYATQGIDLISYLEVGLNEYGERQGIDRVKEIFDTHHWTDPSLQLKKLQASPTVTSSKENSENVDLKGIISKLEAAKLEYSAMKTEEDAETFAQEMADELSKYF